MIEYKFWEFGEEINNQSNTSEKQHQELNTKLNRFGKDGWVIKSHTSFHIGNFVYHTFLMGKNIK